MRTVYEMLQNGVISLLLRPIGIHVNADMVHEAMQSQHYEELKKTPIPDDFEDKTPIHKWLRQKEAEGVKISDKMSNVL